LSSLEELESSLPEEERTGVAGDSAWSASTDGEPRTEEALRAAAAPSSPPLGADAVAPAETPPPLKAKASTTAGDLDIEPIAGPLFGDPTSVPGTEDGASRTHARASRGAGFEFATPKAGSKWSGWFLLLLALAAVAIGAFSAFKYLTRERTSPLIDKLAVEVPERPAVAPHPQRDQAPPPIPADVEQPSEPGPKPAGSAEPTALSEPASPRASQSRAKGLSTSEPSALPAERKPKAKTAASAPAPLPAPQTDAPSPSPKDTSRLAPVPGREQHPSSEAQPAAETRPPAAAKPSGEVKPAGETTAPEEAVENLPAADETGRPNSPAAGNPVEPPPLVNASELDVPLERRYAPQPELTPEAREAGVAGRVFLTVLIGPDGSVKEVRIMVEPGYGLGDAAQKAVREWRYSAPASRGEPVRVWKTEIVEFKLPEPWKQQKP
jgi:TonB family protein